ncbi:hypothetical protein [Streptomyces griseoviridis]|uniref:Tachylectin 2 domain-containing protein n=1 Tax=Streptomyces griseoviridis TaxID=45398 RepID=A0ABT9LRY3_STRGD|nr:hypothetical protein [Streptomyces griseoviridis]MDP9686289.1 hypothetical protein [Streptomyces griseoviridis]
MLKALTSTGDDRLPVNAADGRLLEYRIDEAGDWTGRQLVASGWSGFDKRVSPNGGLYYGATSAGGMYWYQDLNPDGGLGNGITLTDAGGVTVHLRSP